MTVHSIERETRAEFIARRVRELMAGQRMTGKAVGQLLGLSHTAVSRRTNGEVEFSIGELELLAGAFGVSEAYLYGFTDDRSPRRGAGASGLYTPSDSNREPAD